MEEINGVWYMRGCDPDSRDCLHSAEELAAYIQKVGFLPLFANEIPGFSVEEHTPAAWWWTDDPARDPWSWRQQLSSREEIAYGKFFHRRAGFVSADRFPVLASLRRDGYDFDARYEDGLAPNRAKKLMIALEPDEEAAGLSMLSCDLKEKAGFGKGGERNFEGILTLLQMQTYLIVADFRRRQNRAGLPYGWNLAVISTPETKWGYDTVTSAYSMKPEDCAANISSQILEHFPHADPNAVDRLLWRGGRTGNA